MNKKGTSKFMSLFVTMMLLLAMIVLLPQSAMAAPTVEGIESQYVTSGQAIWVNLSGFEDAEYVNINVSTNSMTDMNATNATFPATYLKRARTNATGYLNTTVNIPWRAEIGTYLMNISGENQWNYTHQWFNITDIYDVRVTPDPILWNTNEYQACTVKVYNWTGSTYSLMSTEVGAYIYAPNGSEIGNASFTTGSWVETQYFNYTATGGNRETNYTVNITKGGLSGRVAASVYVPVRLKLEDMSISSAAYGDSVTISGRFVDGYGNPVSGYPVALVQPNATIGNVQYGDTVSTNAAGAFAIAAVFNTSGNWYIGTLNTNTGVYRPTDNVTTKNVTGFIHYSTIDVAADVGSITIDPTEVTYGFNFSVNIQVKSSQGDPIVGASVNVSGLGFNFSGTEYDGTTPVTLRNNTASVTGTGGWLNISSSDTGGYNLRFIESGSASFKFWYGGSAADPLVSGSTSMSVTSPGAINTVVTFAATKVQLGTLPDSVEDPPSSTNGDEWGNISTTMTIKVYGKTLEDTKNASFTISGCGIDETIDEVVQPAAGYEIPISPRTGGVLSVTTTNASGGVSSVKDYQIDGLIGEATTSIGDNKEVTVNENETITMTITDGSYAEVHVTRYDQEWQYIDQTNSTVGNGTSGNGLNGVFTFKPACDELGYFVISAMLGYVIGSTQYTYYTYDIVEVVPKHDLEVTVVEPDVYNRTITAGLKYDIAVTVQNASGVISPSDIDSVTGKVINDTYTTLGDEITFSYNSGTAQWEKTNWYPTKSGTLLITAVAYSGEHDGNNSEVTVANATFTFSPSALTAGIDCTDVPVVVTAVDAVGNLLADTSFYLNKCNATNTNVSGNCSNPIALDENGQATIWFSTIGAVVGEFKPTLNGANTASNYANVTGEIKVEYPTFTVAPASVFVGIPNTIKITAKTSEGVAIEGINLTVVPYATASSETAPNPVCTDAAGSAILSLAPTSSGYWNISIATGITVSSTGRLNWTDRLTDTQIEAVSIESMDITLSANPVFEGAPLIVTLKCGTIAIEGATVTFGQMTGTTGSDGKVSFTVPDPGAPSALYTVEASKTGFATVSTTVTVVNVYEIVLKVPTSVNTGATFSVTVMSQGSALAGATVVFNGQTVYSGTDGTATFTAPSDAGNYIVAASYSGHVDTEETVKVVAGGIPGFEMLTLVAALGVCFILLRRRK